MKVLGQQQTARLWVRLEREAIRYYQTLHDAKNQLNGIGPDRFPDVGQALSELQRSHRRLKRRFTVMAFIGRCYTMPLSDGTPHVISELALDCAEQVIGPGAIQAELDKVGR
jgi:hypothetical protein